MNNISNYSSTDHLTTTISTTISRFDEFSFSDVGGLSFSRFIAVIYFCIYCIFMILLAIYVWISQENELDRDFLKSIWSQRSIYGQVIVHFYDTATDLGVMLLWYGYYQDELNGIDYKSMDMAAFFYCSLGACIVYRFFSIMIAFIKVSSDFDEKESVWKKFGRPIMQSLLAIFDIFIFVTIVDSFRSAEAIINENAEKKKRRIARREARKLAEKRNAKKKELTQQIRQLTQNDPTSEQLPRLIAQKKQLEQQTNVRRKDDSANEQTKDDLEEQIELQRKETIEETVDLTEQKERDAALEKDNKDIDFNDLKWTEQEVKDAKFEDIDPEVLQYLRSLFLDDSSNEQYDSINEQKNESSNEQIELERTTFFKNEQSHEMADLELTEPKKENNVIDFEDLKLTEQEEKDAEMEDIDPAVLQYLCMLLEAVFESLPQVVLQTVFLVRSYNEDRLSGSNSNNLIFMSLFASIFSVANKFYLMDKNCVVKKAKSLKPKKKWGECVKPWYIARIFWRFCHVLCRFCIFALMWICLGGYIFGIILACVFVVFNCCWVCVIAMSDGDDLDDDGDEGVMISMMTLQQILLCTVLGSVSLPIINHPLLIFPFRFEENGILLIIITCFAVFRFDCDICANSDSRTVYDNESILVLLVIAYIACFCDIVGFVILYLCQIFEDEPQNLLDIGL